MLNCGILNYYLVLFSLQAVWRDFFSCDKIIGVNVANGGTMTIWCRVAGDKMLMVQGETGGGFELHGIGINANKAEQFPHVAGATRGYSQILRGNTLEFEASTSSNSVYMTIIKESGSTICKNQEISRSRNYIINHRGGLLDAKKKEKWIDTNGRDHMITYDITNKYDTKTGGDHEYFRPEDHFSSKCW